MIIDMHIHTHFSPCSIIGIEQLLKRAYEIGLDGICITDHDTTAARYALHNINYKNDLCVIIGMEYTTTEGDFLVFLPSHDIPKGLNALELSKYVTKQDGIVIPAHPFRKSRPTNPTILNLSHIIEVINGRNSYFENELSNNWLRFQGNGTKGIGGSDAHTIDEVGRIVTIFDKNIYCMEDLIRQLYSGNYVPIQKSYEMAKTF